MVYRRVFYKHLAVDKIFVVVVYVNDSSTVCDEESEWERFHAAWSPEFGDSVNVAEVADDFCGVLTKDLPSGAVAFSSRKVLLALTASSGLSGGLCLLSEEAQTLPWSKRSISLRHNYLSVPPKQRKNTKNTNRHR